MPTTDKQQFIDDLISTIDQAEEAGSVTNTAVAAVLDHLNTGSKELSNDIKYAQQLGRELESADEDLKNSLEELQAAASNAQATADAAKQVTDTRGLPDGLATLDGSGRLKESQLPGRADSVVEFAGFLDEAPELTQNSAAGLGSVVYCTATARFLFRTGALEAQYFGTWPFGASYGSQSSEGVAPASGKLYIDTTTDKQYRWDGSAMVIVGTNLALGHTDQTAYPGNEGAKLREDVDSLQATIITKADFKEVNALEKKVSGVGIYPFDGIADPLALLPPVSGVWWRPALKGVSGDSGSFLFCSSPFGFTKGDYNDAKGIPRTDRLYILGGDLYRIVDGELRELCSISIALGYTSQTAYPGNEGARVRSDVDDLSIKVDSVVKQLQKQQQQFDIFQEYFSTNSLGHWEDPLEWNNDGLWENGSGCQCSTSEGDITQIYDPITQSLNLSAIIARYDAPTESLYM